MSKFRYLKIKSLLKVASKKDDKMSPVRVLSELSPETILSLPSLSEQQMLAEGFDPTEFSDEELDKPISDEELQSILGDFGFQKELLSASSERPSMEELEKLYQESKKKI